jgi:hypothetical protein
MNKKIARVTWTCPKCGLDQDGCKKGSKERSVCGSPGGFDGCSGFICECTVPGNEEADHGMTYGMPCQDAHCYHCGWQGVFPKPPKKPKDWEKKALAAGWQPPKGWPNA